MKKQLKKIGDLFFNLLDKKNQLIYITDPADWVIKWEGIQKNKSLNDQGLITAAIKTTPLGLSNKIIHFGCHYTIDSIPKIKPSNQLVVTYYHVIPNEDKLIQLLKFKDKISFIHTSCHSTKKTLLKLGLASEKIVVIPLGVDLVNFQSFTPQRKATLRQQLRLPADKIIIGSFQKDGDGWQEGNNPKLIKGPDIFCSVIERLAKNYPIHVLLTGPARGYVKNRLAQRGIPFTHHYLKNYFDIVNYFNVLDLYLITSRLEGGPKAILECWATGVPLISTKVGMVPDIAVDQQDALLTEIENIDELIKKAELVLNNPLLKNNLIVNGLEKVRKFDWPQIARRHYQEIYSHLQ